MATTDEILDRASELLESAARHLTDSDGADAKRVLMLAHTASVNAYRAGWWLETCRADTALVRMLKAQQEVTATAASERFDEALDSIS